MTPSPWSRALLRVELDDQLFVDWHGQIGTRRQGLDAARERLGAHLEPLRNASPMRATWRLRSRTVIVSPGRTRYDGTSTFRPLTRKWPCRTSCRASAREVAKPIRYTMLSSLRSSSS